jgi:hypothetical protein
MLLSVVVTLPNGHTCPAFPLQRRTCAIRQPALCLFNLRDLLPRLGRSKGLRLRNETFGTLAASISMDWFPLLRVLATISGHAFGSSFVPSRQTLGRSQFSREAFFQGVPRNAIASARYQNVSNTHSTVRHAEHGFGILQETVSERAGRQSLSVPKAAIKNGLKRRHFGRRKNG